MTAMTLTDREEQPVPEPRGPHLPDPVGRVPLPVWGFVAVAAWVAWVEWDRAIQQNTGRAIPVVDLVSMAATAMPLVLPPLAAAGLFLHHRDAHRTMPMLAFGLVLQAAYPLLVLLYPVVAPVLEGIVPGSPDQPPFQGPLAFGFRLLAGMFQAFGLIYMARGLSQARRFLDAPRSRLLVGLALAAAVVLPIVNAWSVLTDAAAINQAPTVIATLVVSLLSLLGWAYVAAAAVNGRRAGEDPGIGWSLAAVGGWLVLVGTALVATATAAVLLVPPIDMNSGLAPLYLTVARVHGMAVGVAWILLVAAFVSGLPADRWNAADDEGLAPSDGVNDAAENAMTRLPDGAASVALD